MTDLTPSTRSAPGGRNAAFKLFGIGFLTLVMIVPLMLISSLVNERQRYAAEAAASVAQGWGGTQSVAGPFLVVPYTIAERRDERGAILSPAQSGQIVVLAKALDAAAAPWVEERARGIFRVPVYATDIDLAGSFERPGEMDLPAGAVLAWDRAWLSVAISDVRGISGAVTLVWAGEARSDFAPGTGASAAPDGVHVPIALGADETSFRLTLRLRGTGRLAFVPAAETFSARIASSWPHPSFDGAYLPEEREVGPDGFSATWRVSHLARPLPQVWDNGAGVGFAPAEFGVTFFQPVDFYALVDRSLKYAILFVGLSFLVFFLAETASGARIHVVQYLLAGAAQVIFYLLLLALAEHTGFTAAYVAAALACVGLTALYAGPILGGVRRGLGVAAALGVLYGLLFTLLNEEDYALLTGAVASFLALAVTMFMTRRIDWYQAQAGIVESLGPPPAGTP